MSSPAEQPHDPEMAALELYHHLINLSPDTGDRALMVTLRMPNGRYVGDVWLSTDDVRDLTDASAGLAAVRDHQEAERLPNADTVDMKQALAALENLANGGDQL